MIYLKGPTDYDHDIRYRKDDRIQHYYYMDMDQGGIPPSSGSQKRKAESVESKRNHELLP